MNDKSMFLHAMQGVKHTGWTYQKALPLNRLKFRFKNRRPNYQIPYIYRNFERKDSCNLYYLKRTESFDWWEKGKAKEEL